MLRISERSLAGKHQREWYLNAIGSQSAVVVTKMEYIHWGEHHRPRTILRVV